MSNKEIIDSIKSHLTGEKEVDVPYLQTELAIYKNIKNEEVIYAIANMLFGYMSKETKEKLDLKTHEALDKRREEYEKVVWLLNEKKYEEAKTILKKLSSLYLKATYAKEQNYYDFEEAAEYFIFCGSVENGRKLKVKRYPEPVTYYHYQLASIYQLEENYEEAINELNICLTYNPICQYALLGLVDLYGRLKMYEEAFETIQIALKYAYSKEQFAYLYKCLGCYYEIKENIDIATVCYLTSNFYKYDEENEKTVIELAKFYGKIDLNSNEDVKHIFDKYNIQHGVSKEVLFALDDFIKYTKKINDIGTCKYLLNIMIELTNKEYYKTELEKLLID